MYFKTIKLGRHIVAPKRFLNFEIISADRYHINNMNFTAQTRANFPTEKFEYLRPAFNVVDANHQSVSTHLARWLGW